MDPAETLSLSKRPSLVRWPELGTAQPAPLPVTLHKAHDMPPALAARWDELVGAACEPNPFAERWFVEPSFRCLAKDDELFLAAVGEGKRLSGILPLQLDHRYGRLKLAHVTNWQHCNAFLGAPLIRRGHEQIFWESLLAHLDRSDWAVGFVHVSGLPEGGAAHVGLELAAKALRRECAIVLREERPRLETTLSAEEYLERTVRAKRRSELRRRRRKLGELGELETRRLGKAGDLDAWTADFLALEKAGWKGEAGSALASDSCTRRFFTELLARAFDADRLDFLRLDLDGRPIAMMTSLLAPPGAFGFKACFDESFARFSPGLLLQIDNLAIIERGDIDWQDSCASADHPVASLWSERGAVVRLTVPLRGVGNRLVHRVARTLEKSSDFFGQLARPESREA